MFLLDTCTLLWLVSDQNKLSLPVKKIIKANANTLFVSAMTAFEIAIKNRNKKLQLPLEAEEWYSKALEFHGINEISLTSKILIQSANLPMLHHDPCDRIIISTALFHHMTILTPDEHIHQYKVNVVWD